MTESKPDTRSKFEIAATWVYEKSLEASKSGRCGVCGFEPWPHDKEKSLLNHIRRRHKDTLVELYDHQVMNLSDLSPTPPSENENEMLAAAGITDVQDLNRFDFLAVPERIKSRIEETGSTGRWVRSDRVDHFKAQGAIVTRVEGSEGGAKQPSTESGNLRSNEMVHITMPHEVARNRRNFKASRITEQLNARSEEVQQTRDKYEKRVYDHLRKERNLDHSKASQVANALVNRRTREAGEVGDPGISIQDQSGSRQL